MNSVAPSLRPIPPSASVRESGSISSWRAPRWVWTAGRGWSVGNSSAPTSASRPFQYSSCPPAPPPSDGRCHRAESAYWMGSQQAGKARRRRSRVQRGKLPPEYPIDQASHTMWCMLSSSWCRSGSRRRSSALTAGHAPGRKDFAPTCGPTGAPLPPAPPAAGC